MKYRIIPAFAELPSFNLNPQKSIVPPSPIKTINPKQVIALIEAARQQDIDEQKPNTLWANKKMFSAAIELINKSGRIDLIPELVALIMSQTRNDLLRTLMNSISHLHPNSPTETYLEHPELTPTCNDAFAQRYLEECRCKTSSFIIASKLKFQPCGLMESCLNERLQSNGGILITPTPEEPQTVWFFKTEALAGHYGLSEAEEWDILLNLATLEAFVPGRNLRTRLGELARQERTIISTTDLLKDIPPKDRRIHFCRLAHYIDGMPQKWHHDMTQLMTQRQTLLNHYVPLKK